MREFICREVVSYRSDDSFTADGLFSTLQNVVFVNLNADISLWRIAGHELLHSLKQNQPGVYLSIT
ncbi:MAG: hypothetical protein ACYC2E_04600 [Sulfuricella sp.]